MSHIALTHLTSQGHYTARENLIVSYRRKACNCHLTCISCYFNASLIQPANRECGSSRISQLKPKCNIALTFYL